MEKLINTRTADKCRSHHQKCMKKYGSAEEIVNAIENGRKNLEQKHNYYHSLPAISLKNKFPEIFPPH